MQGDRQDEEYIDPHGECAHEIATLRKQIADMDAAFHFLSMGEVSKRLRAKTPEHERRVQFEKTEAEAVARHLSKQIV